MEFWNSGALGALWGELLGLMTLTECKPNTSNGNQGLNGLEWCHTSCHSQALDRSVRKERVGFF